MNPVLGVGPTSKAAATLFTFLHLTHAQFLGPDSGNVGCLFSDIVCTSNEVCFNDLVIGRCISASSSNQHVERLGPLSGPSLGLLEAEMTRVFGLGFSWPDAYTQCVFQTLIYTIQHRLPYSQDQCGDFLSAQRLISPDSLEDTDDIYREEGDSPDSLEEQIYLVPDNYEQDQADFQPQPYIYNQEDIDDEGHTLDQDYMPEEDKQEAWLHLQNVLHNLRSSRRPQMSEYVIIPDEDYSDEDGEIILVPYDEELEQPFPVEVSNQYHLPQMLKLDPDNYIPTNLDARQPGSYYNFPDNFDNHPEASSHPVEKREAANFDPEDTLDSDDIASFSPGYGYVVSQPGDIDYVLTPEDIDTDYFDPDSEHVGPDYQPTYVLEDNNDDDFAEQDPDSEDGDDEEMGEIQETPSGTRQRRTDKDTLMETIYPDDSANDISNYDFEYEDNKEADNEDDDILYYNPEDEPIEVESVFNRRGRLDVKKPGPFYSNSPNNFYLDKLQIDDMENDENFDEDPGQTEYEFPLSPQDPKHKKGVESSLASYQDTPAESNNYLYVNIKDRFSSLGQAMQLWQYVADHLEIPKESLEPRAETSSIILKVNSNPRQLNATDMAKILDADTTLKEHARNDLGLELKSFEAGDANNNVMSVYSGPSQLFLLMFLLTAGIAALLLAAAVLLFIRRRSITNDKTKKLQDEAKLEKEEPVKEYKQLVRDWSRSSRASQGSDNQPGAGAGERAGGKGASPNKNQTKEKKNSEGSRTSSTSSWQEEPGVNCMDISTGHLVLSYMEDHLNNTQRLEQEWVGLCAYEAEPNSTSIAFKVENKKKNRYPDKLPYDHNRVLLNALVNGSNSDYINASSVMDHDPRNPTYIISQGPMTNTVADFWQMVWEQGSVVIVMLSKLTENGYQLCHRYWPEEGSEQYHIFEVHLVSEHVWCEDYLVRSLYLKNNQTGETRTVTQFHFLSWPDGNIPTSTKSILEFRRKVNKSYRGRSCPMIIHCSDGVGRSGTYVLIDMVLNRMMKGSKEIDIAATLEHIRDQRAGMVQTRSQFEFCLMAVAEETHAILKALPQ